MDAWQPQKRHNETNLQSSLGATYEPNSDYYMDDLLKFEDFVSSWNGSLDEQLGSLLKTEFSGLEELETTSSPPMEQVLFQGNLPDTVTDLDTSQDTVASKEQILRELDVLQLADKFDKVIDRAWSQGLAPWKFCLMIYNERDGRIKSMVENEWNKREPTSVVVMDAIRSQQEKQETFSQDEILFTKEQYILSYCLLRRICRCKGGESPLLFRFFREAINLGYITPLKAMETIMFLYFHHLNITNALVCTDSDPNYWASFLKSVYGDAFPMELFTNNIESRKLLPVHPCLEWIYCLVDLMSNLRTHPSLGNLVESKLILVVTELLLLYVYKPLSFVETSSCLVAEEKYYIQEEVGHAVVRVSAMFQEYRTVALIRACGRRHPTIWKNLTSWIETTRDVNFSRFSGCLIDGFILTWLKQGRGSAATFVEEEADREMDVASFLKQWNGNIFASPVVTTKIFQFWMGPYEAHPQSEQLVKTWNDLLAALSSQRDQFSTSKQYYELCRQQRHITKEFLRRWLRHRNWKGFQERWGDESTLISRIFLLWNKYLPPFALDEYISMMLAFVLIQLIVMYYGWNMYSSHRISWFHDWIEKWSRSYSWNDSSSSVELFFWILYFSFHARLIKGSVSTYFRIVRGISLTSSFLDARTAATLCWMVVDELDEPPSEEIWHCFGEAWPLEDEVVTSHGSCTYYSGWTASGKTSRSGEDDHHNTQPRNRGRRAAKKEPTNHTDSSNPSLVPPPLPNASPPNNNKSHHPLLWNDAVSSVQSWMGKSNNSEKSSTTQEQPRSWEQVTSTTGISETNFQIAPSDLTFLWEECPRCFYLKVHRKSYRPRLPFPSVFGAIDQQMKEFFSGRRIEEFWQDWNDQENNAQLYEKRGGGSFATLPRSSALWIESKPLKIAKYDACISLRGKIDSYLRMDDGTIGLIDFKTSQIGADLAHIYSRQLHAYAWSLENPVESTRGHHLDGIVSNMGLITFQPLFFRAMIANNDDPHRKTNHMLSPLEASFGGRLHYLPVPREDDRFMEFLEQVVDLLIRDKAPKIDDQTKCPFCQYLVQG